MSDNPVLYLIGIRLRLGNTFPQVKELEDSISDGLAMSGYEGERLMITSVKEISLKVDRELTTEEQTKMKELITEEMKKGFGPVSIEYFRRQSGNVPQEVASAS